MFEFLSELGYEISSRYQTVIRDIKAKSNSFYDAYLDLQEASIKAILEAHGFSYDESRTCGYLLRGEEVADLFIDKLHVPKDVYEAIHNRTAKVNHHKHQKSKHILVDSVIAFMETFHKFMSICCGCSEEFDGEYFRSIFGEYERVNLALIQEKESIVSELEELAKEKRLTEEQLRTYAEALSMSKGMKEDLAEQNDALLREISALKSIKLSVLDQKLNRTIDMLNDLQEYVAESRAVSLAVGYTVVGKERIGTYISLAREELGRPTQIAQPPLVSPQSDLPQEQSDPKVEQEEPENILDTMTRVPKPISLSEYIGEPSNPYIHSKDISILPGELDLKKKKAGIILRFLSLAFGVIVTTVALLLDSWFKLISVFPFLSTIVVLFELIWYVKNLHDISNDSHWISSKASVTLDDEKDMASVHFSFEKGRMTTFVHSSLLISIFILSWTLTFTVSMLFAIYYFAGLESAWATLKSTILSSIGAILSLAEFIIYGRKPISHRGRYISFNQPTGSLIYDSEKYGIEAWQLKKKDSDK